MEKLWQIESRLLACRPCCKDPSLPISENNASQSLGACCVPCAEFLHTYSQSSHNKVSRQELITHFTGKKNDTHIGKVHVQGHKARSGVGTWIQIFISPVPTKLEWPWNASCLIIGWQDSDSADAIGSAIRQFGSYVNLHRSLIFPGPAFSPSTTWR